VLTSTGFSPQVNSQHEALSKITLKNKSVTFSLEKRSLCLMKALQETAYKQLDYTATNSQRKKTETFL
jgi:hypothetical protein